MVITPDGFSFLGAGGGGVVDLRLGGKVKH